MEKVILTDTANIRNNNGYAGSTPVKNDYTFNYNYEK